MDSSKSEATVAIEDGALVGEPEEISSETRTRTLTDKGRQYQLDLKTKILKELRLKLVKQVRSTLLLRGKSENINIIKQEFSKLQVLFGEFQDIYGELSDFKMGKEDMSEVIRMKEQTEREWRTFENDIRAEIVYLEQLNIKQQELEVRSLVFSKSKGSRRSNRSSSVKSVKLHLEQEQAALRVKLAFMEEETKLKQEQKRIELLKQEQEENLKRLQLKNELAQNQAKLDICITTEKEEEFGSDISIGMPDSGFDKETQMKRFLDSQAGNEVLESLPVNYQDALVPAEPVIQPPFPPMELIVDASQQASNVSNQDMLKKCMDKLVDVNTKLTEVTLDQNDVNIKLAASVQLPKINIPIFDGDPLQYPVWRSSFEAFIDSKPMDATSKLNFLGQYVTGKPKVIVEHFLLIGSENAYTSAKDLLHERYGNNNVISVAFMNKLEAWPSIGVRSAEALQEFSDFLQKVRAAKNTIASLDVLDFAKENVKMVSKLPYQIQNKWRDHIQQWKMSNGEDSYPPFLQFVKFVKTCAYKANIPELVELSKIKDNPKQIRRIPFDQKGASAYKTFHKEEIVASKLKDSNETNVKHCSYCKEDHHLNKCKTFAERSLKAKKNFFFKNNLCFGCATEGHRIADCKQKLECDKCAELHPMCLHNEVKKEDRSCKCTNVCSIVGQSGGVDHAMIVPVWVRHGSYPDKEFLQYAILDDQSNVSFVSRTLCDKLKIAGPTTELLLTTVQDSKVRIQSSRIQGLEVSDYLHQNHVKLPMMFRRDNLPATRSQIPRPEVAVKWDHLRMIADKMMPYSPDIEISLLIGNNCPKVVRPREVLVGGEDDPYGQRSLLGWGIIGKVCQSEDDEGIFTASCNKVMGEESYPNFVFPTMIKEIMNPEKVIQVLESDFIESCSERKPYSMDDQRFIRILENGIKKLPNGHYEMPLPLKSDSVSLPYNRMLAVKRWNQLLVRFKKNPKFQLDYIAFMSNVIGECAERVPLNDLNSRNGKVNYVSHTGVYHPKKPGQIRVVFDCSAKCNGVSLNDYLLQGPDQINNLLGILCRFRQERVAFLTDIQSMFHQFIVAEEYRDLLRFLWWKDNNPKNAVVEYRMKVHLFGAVSSPGCANFGLKRAAAEGRAEFGDAAAQFIKRDFYVDDGVKSVPTVDEAVSMIKNSQGICAKAGMKLPKIMSNSKQVLESIPVDERAKGVKNLDLSKDPLPVEHALGIIWCVENDSFQFRIELRDRPFTRRGILSTIGSIYDPNGYISPVTLKGKQMLQRMCRDKLDWDSPVPEDLRSLWEKWRIEILQVEKLQFPRCFKPEHFGSIKVSEIHHFSDASMLGYGQCSYIRLVNKNVEVHGTLIVAKARVTPLKQLTIPRLELAAATISARMSKFLRKELSYEEMNEYFWTDSKIVLGYITNSAKRFHTFVANRVQYIRDVSEPVSWMYVDSKNNPADCASRGLDASQLVDGCTWLCGPDFLWNGGPFQRQDNETFCVDDNDPEVRNAVVHQVHVTESKNYDWVIDRLNHVPSWYRAQKAVALCLRFKVKLQRRELKNRPHTFRGHVDTFPISLLELQAAEKNFKSSAIKAFRK